MDLIQWPYASYDDDYGYRDSGEGGLFVYAVWALPQVSCSVDVVPALGLGDVMVNARGPLADVFREQRNSLNNWNPGEDYELTMARLQRSFGTVVFLGSTSASLYYENDGYFAPAVDNLTDAGKTLVQSLTAVYGSEPTLVTYLDT